MNLSIPVVVLVLTLINGEGMFGHAIAPIPEGMGQCEYVKAQLIHDERVTKEIEDEMDPDDVEPRTKLRVATCIQMKVPHKGEYANNLGG